MVCLGESQDRCSFLNALPLGEPVQYEQLFEYTNGRFLVNEVRETAKRYARFDVDALCTLVSSLPSVSSPISKIDKMEGGFNKALLMTAENGKRSLQRYRVLNLYHQSIAPHLKRLLWTSVKFVWRLKKRDC